LLFITHPQQDMKAAGLMLKEEPHTLRVPRSQRGGEVIEPLVSEQWFVKMETLAAPGEPRCMRVRQPFAPASFDGIPHQPWMRSSGVT
jgi:valyl-tRNA synthetase